MIDVAFSTLCFTDIEGTKFLLPPFMIYALKHYETSDSVSIDSAIYALNRPEQLGNPEFTLNKKQIATIINFLKYMSYHSNEDFTDTVVAHQALTNYWSKYE